MMSKFVKLAIVAIALMLPMRAGAQVDTAIVVFSLDTLSIDSFFLVRTDSIFTVSAQRPKILKEYRLFRDTAELNEFIAQTAAQFTTLTNQRDQIAREWARLDYEVKRLECLRDSVFRGQGCTGIGARSIKLPSKFDIEDGVPKGYKPSQSPVNQEAINPKRASPNRKRKKP